MGLRDDIEDAPGKEPVVVKLTERDKEVLDIARNRAEGLRVWSANKHLFKPFLSAPVEAALHDFSLALDQAIKDHLNKVRTDD